MDLEEMERDEGMTLPEVARLIEWMRLKGISDKKICDCLLYIATGVGLPTQAD